MTRAGRAAAVAAGLLLAPGAADAQLIRLSGGATTLTGDAYVNTQMGQSLSVGLIGGRDLGFGFDATLAEVEVMDEDQKLISGAVDMITEIRPSSSVYVDLRVGVERQVHNASSGRSRFDGWRAGGGLGFRAGGGPLRVDAQILGFYFAAVTGSVGGQNLASVDRSGPRVAGRIGVVLGGG